MQTAIRFPVSSRGLFIAGSVSSARSSAPARPLPPVVARSGGADSSPGSVQPPPAGAAQSQSGTSSGLSASSRPQSASASQPSSSSPTPPSSPSPLSLLSSPPPSVSANTRARLFDSPSSTSYPPARTLDPLETSFEGIMAFDAPGPELINGRLAMLGFIAGMSREVVGGVSLQQQLADPGEMGIAALMLAAVLVSLASLPPLLKGVRPEDRSFLFFSWEAEQLNGRVAMLAFIGVYTVEYIASVLLQ